MGNRMYDYKALETEFVTSYEDISIRELARRHGIEEPSSVHAQARKRDAQGLSWYDKRDEYKQLQHQRTIDAIADKRAAAAGREAELFSKAVDAIDLAFDQLITGLSEGTVKVEVKDFALLIDRVNVMFNRPSTITEGRNLGLSVSTEATSDEFKRILELTAGVAGRDLGGGAAATTLPRAEGPRSH